MDKLTKYVPAAIGAVILVILIRLLFGNKQAKQTNVESRVLRRDSNTCRKLAEKTSGKAFPGPFRSAVKKRARAIYQSMIYNACMAGSPIPQPPVISNGRILVTTSSGYQQTLYSTGGATTGGTGNNTNSYTYNNVVGDGGCTMCGWDLQLMHMAQ